MLISEIFSQAKLRMISIPDVVDPETLKTQLRACHDIITVLDIVEPGLTRRRGQVLRSMVRIQLRLMQTLETLPGMEMMKIVKHLMMVTNEVGQCLLQNHVVSEMREELSRTMRTIMLAQASKKNQ